MNPDECKDDLLELAKKLQSAGFHITGDALEFAVNKKFAEQPQRLHQLHDIISMWAFGDE